MKSLQALKGIGPKRLNQLEVMGIESLEALVAHKPVSYLDLTNPVPISRLGTGLMCFVGQISGISEHRGQKAHMTSIRVKDKSGVVKCVFFNQPFRARSLRTGESYMFCGQVTQSAGILQVLNPHVLEADGADGLIPRYSNLNDIPQKVFRGVMKQALGLMELPGDPLPAGFRAEFSLCSLSFALENIHFPQTREALDSARRRLVFEELLCYLVAVKLAGRNEDERCMPLLPDNTHIKKAVTALPYALTAAQRRVLREVFEDIGKRIPMRRLVQGDVGSGKTAVALLAAYAAVLCSCQAALMAPTEILAIQHYESAKEWLGPLGVKVKLLTGGTPAAERRSVLKELASGECKLIIGTHALFQKGVNYNNLGFVIVDEQHRFGVAQRMALLHKGESPHMLVLSATPIPRTLALILYGDLDISVIDELPPGRTPVKTYRVPDEKREDMLSFLKREIEKGRQAYVVCPLIEEDEESGKSDATRTAYELASSLGVRVELVHGRMSSAKKDDILKRFGDGQIDVLVSTTVIEVGVNVPNASIMVVMDAERFGLAQLHQLRGRVGRGEHESYCFLVSRDKEEADRLKILCRTNDGFLISEEDLKQRGPGELLGTRQHGDFGFNFAGLAGDMRVVEQAASAAKRLIEDEQWRIEYLPSIEKSAVRFFADAKEIAVN